MKRKLLVLSVAAICLAIIAAGTLAYFNAEDKAHNVITTGGINIAVQEWADEEKTQPFEDKEGIMPGNVVTKIVEVENTGANEAWVRVKFSVNIALAGDGEADPSLIHLAINDEKWIDGGDGYYYYSEPLAPGETTSEALSSVSFDKTMGNEYQGATATVDVEAEAVQTANNGASATEAAGWPE